ncbi:hypothetical protein SAMN05443545_10778 [Aidingimonas halophila]|uniref:Uncharacterized protein n=1 Tax=Aidingimonas halophila TaxID=574349 RepID=A0A1H3EEL3_9GAMM|nr:hypothetical protein SAMN05443545_10778 [Aidingimonas halophila]
MTIGYPPSAVYDAEVLQFWARQASLQRAAFDALADYLR